MTPQEKCVSLETAKKLKEAGFPQDTERWWRTAPLGSEDGGRYHICFGHGFDWDTFLQISAPDAQEIGELLPFRSKRMGTVNDALFTEHKLAHPYKGQWYIVGYVDEDTSKYPFDFLTYEGKLMRFDHENEAEARAACWLYLKENGLIQSK